MLKRLTVGPAVLEVIDLDQFGAVPKSSTVQTLMSMIHQLTQATDGTGAAVRLLVLQKGIWSYWWYSFGAKDLQASHSVWNCSLGVQYPVMDPAIVVNNKELDIVDHAKILGLTISNDSRWNAHVSEWIEKANKRVYFLVLLKRAKVPVLDIVNFYCTCIRSILEYCSTTFHYALPAYLNDDLERIQRRALSIISPGVS